MATWDDVRAHLREKFKLSIDEPTWIGLGWKFPGPRGGELAQRQRVEPVTAFGRSYVLIWCDIIEIEKVPMRTALERNLTLAIGSIAISDNLYVLRSVMLLDNIDWQLFDLTLEYTAREAAMLRDGVPTTLPPADDSQVT